MAEFNISGSKIDQLNESGDNVKVTGNRGQVVVSGRDAGQAVGDNNRVQAASESWLSKAWAFLKGLWAKWFGG